MQQMKELGDISDRLGEDPADCFYGDLLMAKEKIEKKLLLLQGGAGEGIEAQAVFSCAEMEEDQICRGIYADDTIHLDEGLAPFSKSGLLPPTLHIENSIVPLKVLRAYSLNTGRAHAKGQAVAAHKIKIREGELDLHTAQSHKDDIVFLIVQNPAGVGFLKYVWLFGGAAPIQK